MQDEATTGAAAAPEHELATHVRDGVEVTLDMTYARSWDGVRAAARMRSTELTETDRFLATIGYYERVCPNIDEVARALQEARPGEEVTGNDVMAFVAGAVKKGTPKN